MDTVQLALTYHGLGLAVLPLPYGRKWARQEWSQYRRVPPDRRELALLFSGGPKNVAVICGSASGNLLALDCDDPKTFGETRRRLDGRGIRSWTIRRPPNGSEHDGGGTFVLRTPEAVTSRKAGALDVRGDGQYILVPDSLHPGGTVYYSETPATLFVLSSLATLDWLDLRPAVEQPDQPRIPQLARRILRGDPKALERYPSRSEAEAALCASLAQAGFFTFSDAKSLLLRHGGPGKFVEMHARDPSNAARYLELTWRNAAEWVAAHASEAVLLARRLRVRARSIPWPGRGGSSDRAIYLSHLEIVERCGRDPHGASVRELAELAGVGCKTAARANGRLVDAGLLQLHTKATVSLPHVWRLVLPSGVDRSHGEPILTHSITPSQVMECVSIHAHDAFRWRGLNKSGGEVLEALLVAQEASANELAETTGRHPTTVRRRLDDMRTVGLVEPVGDGHWRVTSDLDLDEVAEMLGTAGAGARQKERHTRDRRLHTLRLERGRQERDPSVRRQYAKRGGGR